MVDINIPSISPLNRDIIRLHSHTPLIPQTTHEPLSRLYYSYSTKTARMTPPTNNNTATSSTEKPIITPTEAEKAIHFEDRWAQATHSQRGIFAEAVRHFAEKGQWHPMFPGGRAGEYLVYKHIVGVSGADEEWWVRVIPTLKEVEWTREDEEFLNKNSL
ncbi:hypothetical protein BJY04DRAFT_184919 [Aspergillus karnatakaensis]|uniref:uncharacterized protein n=1 Tax=Aspergillus karnatakaensis TaxID=1810916 RepID=UPI003CCDAAE8